MVKEQSGQEIARNTNQTVDTQNDAHSAQVYPQRIELGNQ
jgi:hypothetical protein